MNCCDDALKSYSGSMRSCGDAPMSYDDGPMSCDDGLTSYDALRSCDDAPKSCEKMNDDFCAQMMKMNNYLVGSLSINTPFTRYL